MVPNQRVPPMSATANATADTTALFDPARLDRPDTLVREEPFRFLVASGQLPAQAADELRRDFPRYAGAGFFPYDAADCGPSINRLVGELTEPTVASAIGARLGIARLGGYPTLVTLCRALNKRHGTIHTDSRSKVATALLYLNADWPDTSAGCFRFLDRDDNIDAMIVPELRPLYGNLAVFKRADNSFHGHLPYEGERLVIQIAWLTSEDEKRRKTRRGRFSRLFKWLFGALDRRFGAGRDRNAAHRD